MSASTATHTGENVSIVSERASETRPERIRCGPIMRVPFGSQYDLLHLEARNRTLLCRSATSRLLNACTRFRSIDEHIKNLCNEGVIRNEHSVAIANELRTLERYGAFVSAGELMDACRATATLKDTGIDQARIECLCIPTCSRPRALAGALASYAKNLKDFGREAELVICDDSKSEETQRSSREAAIQALRPFKLPLLYAGVPEKSAYIRALVAQGVPRESVETALCGFRSGVSGIGANRNALLLHTAGRMLLSVDDDTVCAPRVIRTSEQWKVRLCGDADASEFWFHANREEAILSMYPDERDVLGAHEALLGKNVAEVITSIIGDAGSEVHNQVNMDELCSHLVSAILSGKGRVRITINGAYGDSGMHSGPAHHLRSSKETLDRLMQSEANYRTALMSREIVRQASTLSLVHGVPCPSMFWALDNRTLFPPFLPAYRAEDTVFTFFLQRIQEDAYLAHLPFSLLHAPEVERSYNVNAIAGIRMSDIVMTLASMWHDTSNVTSPEKRIRKIGEYLLDIGSLGAKPFRDLLSRALWIRASQFSAVQEAMLKEHPNAPAFWRDGIQQQAEQLRTAAIRPEYIVPTDLPTSMSIDDALATIQSELAQFGCLMRDWPDIVDAAKYLAERGVRLAVST